MAFRDPRPSERAAPTGFRSPRAAELQDPLRRQHMPIESWVERARSADSGPQHPYARREQATSAWRPTQADILEAHGVDPSGAPIYARRMASYTMEGQHTPDTLRTALRQHFGEPVNVRKREGALEFRHPETGRWTIYNPPSMDLGDVASFEGELYPMGGTAVGAGGGALIGSGLAGPAGTVSGAVTGDFAGTMLGEFERLAEGRRRGMIDERMTDEDLLAEAATTAAIEAGLGLGLAGVGKLVTNWVSRTGLDIDADEVIRRVKSKMQQHRVFGTEPTSGQLLQGTPAGERLLQQQHEIMPSPTPYGDVLRRRQFENVRRAAQGLDRSMGPGSGEQNLLDIERYIRQQAAGDTDVGENIQELARQRVATREEPVASELERLRQDAVRAVDEVGEGADPTAIGAPVRDALERAVSEFRDEAERRYGEARELLQSAGRVTPNQLLKLARDRKQLIESDVYKNLAPEDQRLIDQTLRLAGKSGRKGKKAGQAQAPRQVSFQQADRAVKALRRLERESRRGIKPAPELRLVRELKEQWEQVRRDIASQVPGGVEQLEAADAFYRQNVSRLYESVVGELLDTKPGSFQYDVAPEQVFQKIFKRRDPSRAREIFYIVDRPEFANARRKIGDAIKQEWRDRVLRDDNTVNPQAHSRFMRDYGGQIQLFLSPAERRSMKNAGTFKRELDRQTQRLKDLQREARRRLDTKLANLEDPASVIRATWTRSQPSRAVELKKMLDEDPQGARLIPAYQNVIRKRIFNEATSKREGVRQIDSEKLRELADTMGPALDSWFGRGTAERFDRLADAVQDLEAQPLAQPRPSGLANVTTDITRAGVGQFTLLGRLLTAFRRLAGRQGERMASDMLLNPDYLAKLQRRQRNLRGVPTAAGVSLSSMTLPSLSETELSPRRLLRGPRAADSQR